MSKCRNSVILLATSLVFVLLTNSVAKGDDVYFDWEWFGGGKQTNVKFYEKYNPVAGISVSGSIDWSKVPSDVNTATLSWRMQYFGEGQWAEDEGCPHPKVEYNLFRNDKQSEISDTLQICGYDSNNVYRNGIYRYRIYDDFLQRTLVEFKIEFIPDIGKASMGIKFPAMVQYGKTSTASVTTSPRFSGTCSYFRYYNGDILIGKSKLTNGKSSLSFKTIWVGPSGTSQTLKVVCAGGRFRASGIISYVGTKP